MWNNEHDMVQNTYEGYYVLNIQLMSHNRKKSAALQRSGSLC